MAVQADEAAQAGWLTPSPSANRRRDLAARLADWYQQAARDLPWRHPGTTPWGVVVSEVMAQQTPVLRVVPYWQRWLAAWPRPSDLAAASPADVIRAWGTLGYPRRGLRLRDCAVTLVASYGGEVPPDEATLRGLPGLGRYSAAAIASFAFGRRAVVLDTNIRRVVARVWEAEGWPPPSPTAAEWARAGELLPIDPAESVAWNRATMELGALICRARQPDCAVCPIQSDCAWYAEGCPGDPAARPPGQPYHGTDRQARGRVLALLRQMDGESLPTAAIIAALPQPDQAERAIASLVADGLAVRDGAALRLPE